MRGYITGSLWRDYQSRQGERLRHRLAGRAAQGPGLRRAGRHPLHQGRSTASTTSPSARRRSSRQGLVPAERLGRGAERWRCASSSAGRSGPAAAGSSWSTPSTRWASRRRPAGGHRRDPHARLLALLGGGRATRSASAAGEEQEMLDKENIRQWLLARARLLRPRQSRPPSPTRCGSCSPASTSSSTSCSPASPSSPPIGSVDARIRRNLTAKGYVAAAEEPWFRPQCPRSALPNTRWKIVSTCFRWYPRSKQAAISASESAAHLGDRPLQRRPEVDPLLPDLHGVALHVARRPPGAPRPCPPARAAPAGSRRGRRCAPGSPPCAPGRRAAPSTMPREAVQREVEGDGGVGADHPLHRGVADVALVPERHVLQRRHRVAAQQPRQAGQVLGEDGVALVRHGRASPSDPAVNGSSASRTSVRCRWRTSVACCSSVPPATARAQK